MILSLIAAVAENGVIGCDGRMPWHLREDLARFKRITTGHPVVMGRKTFESLGSRPLPNRPNVVVTRRAADCRVPEGVTVVASPEEAVRRYADTDEELFIIGGGEIYRQTIPAADKLYLTRIFASPQGDTYFPEVRPEEWRPVWREAHPASEEGTVPGFEFVDYIRIKRR
ncbi:dihydrofolate reductase [uncultured Rikenella sp.]|uniref:dihydrofolate reductase n=1 Tax=uncultured Rikenella sp. TaxID=368003 RepID=UPI0025D65427|nr:dihydrofolate reductase [uncultured Rikenella sp.]